MERDLDRALPRAGASLVGATPEERAQAVKARAAALGFDACGVAVAGHVDPENRFGAWLARGFHADMDWLAETRALRQDACLRQPGARSVIVVARSYYHPRPEAAAGSGRVARYAWGKDYHKALRAPIRQLARYVDALAPGAESCISIDSKAVMERAWAERAGIGWVGKNSLVLNRTLGSWFFLGTVISTVEIAADVVAEAHCGTCRACVDACPTQAIVEDSVVDAGRCISYQTIEQVGAIPESLHSSMGDWVFGCDVCQEVCPWNRFVEPSVTPGILPRPGIANPNLAEIAAMDAAAFDQYFAGTPVRRATHTGMLRNAAIAQANQLHEEKS